ncbi:MAG: nucleotidyltransferase family protein [Nitrospirae bacterium]|nr:nucleotidyltransferase family protein [Nitrospirota bacterium]
MIVQNLLKDKADGIRRIARKNGVVRLSVFGSFAHGKPTRESDLDLLVEFEPGRDLLDLIGLKQELEELLGRKVDIVTERALSPHLRDQILLEAVPL